MTARFLVACAALVFALSGTVASAQTIWSGVSVADAFVTTGPTNNLEANNYGAAGRARRVRLRRFESRKLPRALRVGSPLRPSGAKSAFDAAYGEGLWQVQSATLRLTTTAANNAIFNNNSTGLFSISWMQNDSWIEGTGSPGLPASNGITWLSLPDFLSLADEALGTFLFDTATSGGDQAHTTYSLNLTTGFLGDIMGGASAGLEIAAASDSVSYLLTRGSVNTSPDRPLLTIVAAPVPEPLPERY